MRERAFKGEKSTVYVKSIKIIILPAVLLLMVGDGKCPSYRLLPHTLYSKLTLSPSLQFEFLCLYAFVFVSVCVCDMC